MTIEIRKIHKDKYTKDRFFRITQKDTSEQGCHPTEQLIIEAVVHTVHGQIIEKKMAVIDSWMNRWTLDSSLEDDIVYLANDEKRIRLLDAMIRGIDDSYDQSPPIGKDLEVVNALKSALDLMKSV